MGPFRDGPAKAAVFASADDGLNQRLVHRQLVPPVMGAAAFMLPLIFFDNRELLLIDVTFGDVLFVLPGAIVAMLCFAAALEGWAFGRLAWWARGLLIVTSFLLIQPDLVKTSVGAGLLVVVPAAQRLTARASDYNTQHE